MSITDAPGSGMRKVGPDEEPRFTERDVEKIAEKSVEFEKAAKKREGEYEFEKGGAVVKIDALPLMDGSNPIANKSITEIDSMLFSRLNSMSAAEILLSRANASFNQKTARHNFKTDAEHQAYVAEEGDAVLQAEANAQRACWEADQLARQVMQIVENPAPPSLPEAEEGRASSLAVFVKEDFEFLPIENLRDNIMAAIQRNDRPRMFLYYRYATLPGVRPDKLHQADTAQHSVKIKMEVVRLVQSIAIALGDTRMNPLRAKAEEMQAKAKALRQVGSVRSQERDLENKRKGYGIF